MLRWVVIGSIFCVLSCAQAGDYNKKLSIGSQAPTFANLPNVDDKSFSFEDFKADIVVVCFTCNHCPVAMAYEDRILEFVTKYQGKVDFVAINPVQGEEDDLPAMKQRAKEKKFTFPYLYDASQKTGRAYGASVTPEFFVLNKERKVVYMGALDDNINEPKIKEKYLEQAVDALLTGKAPSVTETLSRGCSIKYKK